MHWVSPKLVAEMMFTEWTVDDRLRHPRYLGLRDDKSPPFASHEMSTRRFGRITVELSNTDKLIFPDDGVTKGDLIEYYACIAETMLPHAKDRPLTLHRFPEGT